MEVKDISGRMKNIYAGQKRRREEKKPAKVKKFDYGSASLQDVKYKKEKSAEQKILDLIIKGMGEQEKSYENIIQFLRSEKRGIGSDVAMFYSTLVNNIHDNVKINLNDLINQKNFLLTIDFGDANYPFNMNVFSNDRLTWISIVYQYCKDKFDKYLTFVLLDNMEISIRTLLGQIDTNYKKGFYIDFNKDLSFIGYNLLSDEEKAAFIAADSPDALYTAVKTNEYIIKAKTESKNCYIGSYTINGITYIYKFAGNGLCLTYNEKIASNVTELLKKAKHIEGKSEKEEDLKLHNLEKNQPYCYISQKIRLTNFSPSVIEINSVFPTTFSLTSELDLNTFEEQAYKAFISSKKYALYNLINIPNFVFIDNFEGIVQFLIVEYHIRYKTLKVGDDGGEYQKFLTQYKDFMEYHVKNRAYFKVLKNFCSSAIRFYLRFYDSFTNKISIDTAKSLRKILDKLYAEYNNIKDDTEIKNVEKKYKEFFESERTFYGNPFIGFMNSIDLNSHKQILDNIWVAINNINKGIYTNLIKNLMDAGYYVYRITYGSGGNIMTREMRSPSSFMGNLFGEDMGTIKSSIAKLVVSDAKKEVKDSDLIDTVKIALSDEDALKRSIALLSEQERGQLYDFEADKFTEVFEPFYKSITETLNKVITDSNILMNLKVYGSLSKINKEPLELETYGLVELSKNLGSMFASYVETNKLKDRLAALSKKAKVASIEAEPSATFNIFEGKVVPSGGLTPEQASKINVEFVGEEKDINEFLVKKGVDKNQAKDLVESGLIGRFASYGITLPALINALGFYTGLISKDKSFITDTNLMSLINSSKSLASVS